MGRAGKRAGSSASGRPLWRRRGAPLLRAAAALTLVAAAAPARAQEPSVRISVDRHLAAVGEPIQVNVEVSASGDGGFAFVPPSFDGFRIAGGGMTTQQISIVNGRVTRREGRVYTVIPVRAGKLVIGPAAVRSGGRTYKSNRVVVDVREGAVPGAPSPGTPPPAAGSPGAPPPGAPPAREPQPAPGPGGAGPLPPVFIDVEVTPRRVYVGQQVIAVWRLYTQTDILGYRAVKQPSADGFWAEELRSPRSLQFEERTVRGRLYYAAVLLRRALFPERAGRLTVGPLVAGVQTVDAMLTGAQEIASPSAEVEVLPLPAAGRPPGMPEQNVGRYAISASLDRDHVEAGEAARLRVVIRGVGNIRQVVPPKLPRIEGAKVYEPEVKDRVRAGDRIEGEKLVTYLLMPRRPGRIAIPALHLDYFDPETERYRRASTRPLALTVTGDFAKLAEGGTKPGKNRLRRDIRPPRAARHLTDRGPRRGLPPYGAVALGLPVLLFAGFVAGERVRARLRRETDRAQARVVSRRVRRALKAASRHAAAGERAATWRELRVALAAQLDRAIGRPAEGLTREEIARALTEAGYEASLVAEVVALLEAIDVARFAPGAAAPIPEGEAVTRARRAAARLAAGPRRGG